MILWGKCKENPETLPKENKAKTQEKGLYPIGNKVVSRGM